MTSDVYYFTARTRSHKESLSKVKGPLSLEKLNFKEKINKDDKVCVKTHFGAEENVRYLRPSYIRFLCDFIKEMGGIPSVAESCGWGVPEKFTGNHTEYSGRSSEEEYLKVALLHGYTPETMGAPILMLDGTNGTNIIKQKINGNIFKEVLVAGRLKEFDYLILASHFKGHPLAGFGGALKNLGIGCVSKGGKVQAHNGKKFIFNYDAPIDDYKECLKICPTKAITKGKNGKLHRDETLCKLCYMCNSVCKNDVIDIGQASREEFIIQMVDNALGVIDYFGRDKIFYLNYVIDVTYQCDCSGGSDVPFVSDIGLLSSLDPVALDQACIDLIHKSAMNPNSALGDINALKNNVNEWFSYIPRSDPDTGKYDYNLNAKKSKHWELQMKVAEELGIGTRNYNLIEVEIEEDN